MDKWIGKIAVVTGASAGMGASIVRYLVQNGMKVVGLSRKIERIEELAKKLADESGTLYAFKCDVSREDDVVRAFRFVKENLGAVHLLVNNAALTRSTSLSDGNTYDWKKIIDVNIIGLCVCTREAIRSMREHDVEGQIINMNSVVGHYVPTMTEPFLNVYPASKFAVTALTETLRQELRYYKSRIKSVSPGVVKTVESPNSDPPEPSETPYLKPEDVAQCIGYVLSTGPNVQIQEVIIRPIGEMF